MSKRPLIYELIDNFSGTVLYSSDNKQEAFEKIRQMIVDKPELHDEASFIILQNGKNIKVLARFTGRALDELLEDED